MIGIEKIKSLLPATVKEFNDIKPGEQASMAHQVKQELIEVLKIANKVGLVEGGLLYQMEEYRLYLLLDYDTFGEFLGDPYIGIKRRWAFELKAIFKKFVIQLQIAPKRLVEIHISKLGTLLPYVNADNVDELLSDAETLSKSDLKMKLLGKSESGGNGEGGVTDNRIPRGNYKLTPVSEDDVDNAEAIEFANCQIYKDDDGNYLAKVV